MKSVEACKRAALCTEDFPATAGIYQVRSFRAGLFLFLRTFFFCSF